MTSLSAVKDLWVSWNSKPSMMDKVMVAVGYYMVPWFLQQNWELMHHENIGGAETILNGLIMMHENEKDRN